MLKNRVERARFDDRQEVYHAGGQDRVQSGCLINLAVKDIIEG